MIALLDAVAFSSLWVAAAAGVLCAAASLAMGVPPLASVVGIAVTGTRVVYNVDRLRDLERDGLTTPHRSAFVARHDHMLVGITGPPGLRSRSDLGHFVHSDAVGQVRGSIRKNHRVSESYLSPTGYFCRSCSARTANSRGSSTRTACRGYRLP